jgi:dinuclear metal center YbgI/SA1388 family protein
MKLRDIAAAIERMVPLKLAQDWDNVGLLVGGPQENVKNILLTIDVTGDVLAEAKKLKTDLILSYHPVIWDGFKKVTSEGPSSIVYDLIRSGIAVFSIHTALDSVTGGVNDGLAEIIGIRDPEPIGDYVESPQAESYKLVAFIPVEAVEKVTNAIFSAGAGVIGNYSHCGFTTYGEGSFFPLAGAKPAVGKRGKLEKVAEVRFETVVPAGKLADCIAEMKKAHPYEMPAFDCYQLHSFEKHGLGRIGKLKKPLPVRQIIQRLKTQTGAKAIGIVGRQNRVVRKAAVCAGSCGKIINAVINAKVDCYITGELKHHHALAAQEANLTCICLSHTVSERFILRKFAGELQNRLKDVTIRLSKKDADPFNWKRL